MEDLEEVNKTLDKFENANRQREYRAKFPEKKKEQNAKWDAKNRKEYQRLYRAKKKLN